MNFDYTGKLDSDGFFIKEDDVHEWCKAMELFDYFYDYKYSEFHQSMALSVNGDVDLADKLEQLNQLPVRFDHIKGALSLEDNQLFSLQGLPKYCKSLYLQNNNLISLSHLPEKINYINLINNPLNFNNIILLTEVEELSTIILPIEFLNKLSENKIPYKKKYDFIIIEDEDIIFFKTKFKENKIREIQSDINFLNNSFKNKKIRLNYDCIK